MRILDETQMRATICLNAKAAELFPDAVKELHRSGHEIAAHSYTQDTILPYLPADKEKDLIRRCAKMIEDAVGERPQGWFSPVAAPTPQTAEILSEEGFLWHGDYNDTDLPYAFKTAGRLLVAIPHSDFTDNRVLRGSPRDFLNVYKDTFDFLYHHEKPSLINLTVHAHFGGRPMMSAMFNELLHYFKGFAGVWFARHDEVARWVLDQQR
jgi:peptidoglycan/xylan/chitin deacetylase (PgdA/CDA1 family)